MASNPGRDIKFSDLDEKLKLLVTKWLPNKDKIKLLDIFPAVVAQIVSINSMDDLMPTKTLQVQEVTDADKEEAVNLFKKLTHLKNIRISADEAATHSLEEYMFTDSHPNLEYIHDRDLMVRNEWSALKFVADRHEADPSYDGSIIQNIFIVPDDQILDFIKNNVDLKLKLGFVTSNDDSTSHLKLFLDNKIRPMIYSMYLIADQQQYLASNPIRFETLTQLELKVQMPSFVGHFEAIRFLNPNIKELIITTTVTDVDNAIKFANCVLSLEKLEFLDLSCRQQSWEDDQVTAYYNLVTVLVTTDKTSLTKLAITNDAADWYMLKTQLNNNIRNGFKFLSICNMDFVCTLFELDHKTIESRNHDSSLIDVFNKFPHVKHFEIGCNEEFSEKKRTYFEGLRAELEVIRDGLPRNRWVTLDIINYRFIDGGWVKSITH